jgi:hypothetical protein
MPSEQLISGSWSPLTIDPGTRIRGYSRLRSLMLVERKSGPSRSTIAPQ